MTRFTLEFSTDSAAFDEDPLAEIARVLRDVADRVTEGQVDGTVRDVNGNALGDFDWMTEEDWMSEEEE